MKLMRNVFLLVMFFIASPVFILFVMFYLVYITSQNPSKLYANNRKVHAFTYAALPSNTYTFSDTVTVQEGRIEILRQFLAKYGSPLEPHAEFIVETADKYEMDFRLLPAIAMQESNLCKKIPAGSHNCWGFGIYGGKVTIFSDYPEAIETVTQTLATKYKGKGLITPEQIMSMYTPSNNGSWARGVNHFMNQLQ